MSREEAIAAGVEVVAFRRGARPDDSWALRPEVEAVLDALLASGHVVLREELEQVAEVEDLVWSVRKVLNGDPHAAVYRLVKPQQGEPK